MLLQVRQIVILLFLYALCACQSKHSRQEIENAMNEYDRLIQKMDTDSIALLYTPDGQLGNIAQGRDSIRHFLATFNNVRVLGVASTSDSVTITGNESIQQGSYRQTCIIQEKDTVRVKGRYIANWLWNAGEGWRIKKMTTIPQTDSK